MWSLLKALNEIEGASVPGIGYSSFAFVAILAEFLSFATWQRLIALPKPQFQSSAESQAE